MLQPWRASGLGTTDVVVFEEQIQTTENIFPYITCQMSQNVTIGATLRVIQIVWNGHENEIKLSFPFSQVHEWIPAQQNCSHMYAI